MRSKFLYWNGKISPQNLKSKFQNSVKLLKHVGYPNFHSCKFQASSVPTVPISETSNWSYLVATGKQTKAKGKIYTVCERKKRYCSDSLFPSNCSSGPSVDYRVCLQMPPCPTTLTTSSYSSHPSSLSWTADGTWFNALPPLVLFYNLFPDRSRNGT